MRRRGRLAFFFPSFFLSFCFGPNEPRFTKKARAVLRPKSRMQTWPGSRVAFEKPHCIFWVEASIFAFAPNMHDMTPASTPSELAAGEEGPGMNAHKGFCHI
jgi:hypothetical protein